MVCTDKMGEVYGTYWGGGRNAYGVLRRKHKGTRKLIRPRHRLRHILKMNHKEIGYEVP